MVHAGVSKCANPECQREFRKLGEGKLYAGRRDNVQGGPHAMWLCGECALRFELRYDRGNHQFHLTGRARPA